MGGKHKYMPQSQYQIASLKEMECPTPFSHNVLSGCELPKYTIEMGCLCCLRSRVLIHSTLLYPIPCVNCEGVLPVEIDCFPGRPDPSALHGGGQDPRAGAAARDHDHHCRGGSYDDRGQEVAPAHQKSVSKLKH